MLLFAAACRPSGGGQPTNPLPIAFGDPFILSAADGNYYMYGTGGVADGFIAYRSRDLIEWDSLGRVYAGNRDGSWDTANFWAPEVYEHEGKYYMFFSADWRDNPGGEAENFRIGVAVADRPAGPFTDYLGGPLFDPGYPAIDGNVFRDNDGRFYLYFSRCCYKHSVESELSEWARTQGLFDSIEESWIYGVELAADFRSVIGEPVMLLRPPVSMSDPQTEWESRSVTTGEVNRRWSEGSVTFKRDGKYYMMYSANFFGGKNYAVGYATAENPLGPYQKSADNPIIQENASRGGTVTGTGHNNVFHSPDGKTMYCVYHGRTTATGNERMVFIDRMEVDEQGQVIIHSSN
jgi:beta-xylosidase